jgi:hypothetical protein
VELNCGRCQSYSSAVSSKIKIRTSSCHKVNWASCHDEVRILIFDNPAELYDWQSGSWEGKLSNASGHATRARCMNFFLTKIYANPARIRSAGLMRQFSSGQLYSSLVNLVKRSKPRREPVTHRFHASPRGPTQDSQKCCIAPF